MLDLKFVVENFETVKEAVEKRGYDPEKLGLLEIVELNRKRKEMQKNLDNYRARKNILSKEIGKAKSRGESIEPLIEEMREVSKNIEALEKQEKEIKDRIKTILLNIPNIPHKSVPVGSGEEDNVVVKVWGKKPEFDFDPRPHWELGEKLRILDFPRAAKMSGSRFAVYAGLGAKLERALINFMLDLHVQNGWKEILPPFMVNTKTMTGTGQLPKFAEDLFKIENWDLWMIPTAEVPLVNLHAGEILDEEELPIYYTAYTPCFRAEAGSYGKDVRGIIRQHQFNKVELVKFTTPETSYQELETLLAEAELVLQKLGLHYRVVELCTGDLGFAASKTYDIEVWMPGLGEYKEISSCSNCEDFQARRANIRLRRKNKKMDWPHTLNGSGLAVGRTVAAILENYQTKEGYIRIPEVLQPYMKTEIIKPNPF